MSRLDEQVEKSVSVIPDRMNVGVVFHEFPVVDEDFGDVPAFVGDQDPDLSSKFVAIGQEIGLLVTKKNRAYGDSFAKCDQFLALLYPDGVRSDQYSNALALVRIFDKMMRIASDEHAFGEEPFSDVVGYGILGVYNSRCRNAQKHLDEAQSVARKETV